jgi:hypothetical protein
MLATSIVLFLVAAAFGAVALLAILRNQSTPKLAVAAHGVVATTAFLLVILFSIRSDTIVAPVASLVYLGTAALGGLTLFTLDRFHVQIPRWLALLHPAVAVMGVLSLIFFAVGL